MSKEGAGLGIGSGFLGSLCCLGPTLILLFGLGSVFGISSACFTQYRLPFLSLALLFLAMGIGLWLKKRGEKCDLKIAKENKKFILSALISMASVYLLTLFVFLPPLQESFLPSACVV